MIHSLSFGQTESILHKILENKIDSVFVEPVDYLVGYLHDTKRVESVCLSKKGDNFIECKIQLKNPDNVDYLNFRIDTMEISPNYMMGILSNISLENSKFSEPNDKIDLPYGLYRFNPETGLESLSIIKRFLINEYPYSIKWKGKSEK